MKTSKPQTTANKKANNELPADGTVLTARGIRSRAALLSAARQMFRQKGYSNTNITDITGEAGCAAGSFYTYFKNKEELLEQLAEDFKTETLTRMSALNTRDTEPYALTRELCAIYWHSCRDHSAELAAMFQAAMVDEHFKRRWQDIRADARKRITVSIISAEAKGLAKAPNPHPEIMASAIGSMMDYFCYIWLIEGGESNNSTLDDEIAIDTMARVFYRSVYATPEPLL